MPTGHITVCVEGSWKGLVVREGVSTFSTLPLGLLDPSPPVFSVCPACVLEDRVRVRDFTRDMGRKDKFRAEMSLLIC